MKIIKNPSKRVYQLYLHFCKFKGLFHSKPDFLIIGGEKCGTTSLNEYLIKHPAATFLAYASGDSMANVGIYDGDLLIIDRSLDALNKAY